MEESFIIKCKKKKKETKRLQVYKNEFFFHQDFDIEVILLMIIL